MMTSGFPSSLDALCVNTCKFKGLLASFASSAALGMNLIPCYCLKHSFFLRTSLALTAPNSCPSVGAHNSFASLASPIINNSRKNFVPGHCKLVTCGQRYFLSQWTHVGLGSFEI